ncbi:MAG TPA: DUF6111 family protein [Xanthobacteraceae bacterium]|jgi:hypothetical protein|nr:DUF6111 family protein [Xanthobacteraceae bacterium]
MIRPFLTEAGLFLTPFVVYVGFLLVTRSDLLLPAAWTARRLASLLIVSLALVVGSFLVLAQFSGAPPGSTYVPAHVDNGRFVPGATRR